MEPAGSFLKFLRRTKKALLDDGEDELHAYVRGSLYPYPVLYALLTAFGVSLRSRWTGSASYSSTPTASSARWAP
jgi:hypothetical protein